VGTTPWNLVPTISAYQKLKWNNRNVFGIKSTQIEDGPKELNFPHPSMNSKAINLSLSIQKEKQQIEMKSMFWVGGGGGWMDQVVCLTHSKGLNE
jgi:CRISPR/Cas system CSM-associated protein Csm5 (group 7 of RAMP superfamily)